jgi:hypothetical protein
MLDWIGLRRQSAGLVLSLRSTTVPSSGCCALRYVSHEPTYERRHQSAITHVSALNARRLQGPLVL